MAETAKRTAGAKAEARSEAADARTAEATQAADAEVAEASGESTPEPPAAPPPAPGPGSIRFEVATFIASAPDLLGCEPFVAAGALHGVEGELSIDDAKAKIEEWLAAPVNQEA